MALENSVIWVFTPDLGETNELADVAHTDVDSTAGGSSPFNPLNATPAELRKASIDYWHLTQAQGDDIQFNPLDNIDTAAEWLHVCEFIYIGIHAAFAGGEEINLPQLAQDRLVLLRAGNPTLGSPL